MRSATLPTGGIARVPAAATSPQSTWGNGEAPTRGRESARAGPIVDPTKTTAVAIDTIKGRRHCTSRASHWQPLAGAFPVQTLAGASCCSELATASDADVGYRASTASLGVADRMAERPEG